MKTYSLNDSATLASLDISRDVFIHPTNSSYGIGASIYNRKGYNTIYELKKRDVGKPLFITVPTIENIKNVGEYTDLIPYYIETYPQKIFTFIIPRSTNLPSYINPEYETVGVQVARGYLTDICRYAKGPVFGTSANISGEQAVFTPQKIRDIFNSQDDIVFLDAGELSRAEPSTIVDLTEENPRIIRGSL